jgi:hypothetical protein
MSEQSEFKQAVVDRIEDGKHAVLLVDDSEEKIVPAGQLPNGASDGTWLQVRFDGDELVEATIDHEATEQARLRVREKMDKLRKRGRKHRPPD